MNGSKFVLQRRFYKTEQLPLIWESDNDIPAVEYFNLCTGKKMCIVLRFMWHKTLYMNNAPTKNH